MCLIKGCLKSLVMTFCVLDFADFLVNCLSRQRFSMVVISFCSLCSAGFPPCQRMVGSHFPKLGAVT